MGLVLVTGATGEVGRLVVPHLRQKFPLRLLSRRPQPGSEWVAADLTCLDDRLLRAMEGVDCVLNLAIATGHTGVYEDDAFNAERFRVNVYGTYALFEAARCRGVRRVVHCSSLMVLWGYGKPEPGKLVPGDAPPKPAGTYALTKALSEQVAQYFAETAGMEVLVIRTAAPLVPDDPRWREIPVPPQRVPVVDLARAFELAVTCPLDGFAVVTIVGESSKRMWDLEPARRVLGYEPSVRLDDLGLRLGDPFVVPEAESDQQAGP